MLVNETLRKISAEGLMWKGIIPVKDNAPVTEHTALSCPLAKPERFACTALSGYKDMRVFNIVPADSLTRDQTGTICQQQNEVMLWNGSGTNPEFSRIRVFQGVQNIIIKDFRVDIIKIQAQRLSVKIVCLKRVRVAVGCVDQIIGLQRSDQTALAVCGVHPRQSLIQNYIADLEPISIDENIFLARINAHSSSFP